MYHCQACSTSTTPTNRKRKNTKNISFLGDQPQTVKDHLIFSFQEMGRAPRRPDSAFDRPQPEIIGDNWINPPTIKNNNPHHIVPIKDQPLEISWVILQFILSENQRQGYFNKLTTIRRRKLNYVETKAETRLKALSFLSWQKEQHWGKKLKR